MLQAATQHVHLRPPPQTHTHICIPTTLASGTSQAPHLRDVAAAKGRNAMDDAEVALPLKAHVGLVLLYGEVQVHGEATPAIPAKGGRMGERLNG